MAPVRGHEHLCDYRNWPQLFTKTIRAVSVICKNGPTTVLRIDHREGIVINVLTIVSAEELRLEEFKKKYDAVFLNRRDHGTSVAGGTDVHRC